MNINFSKFHKIECDDNCTTLEHPSGHTIKIAHQKLSPDMRKELDALPLKMAKGGYAKYAQKYDPSIRSKASKPSGVSKAVPEAAYTPPKEAKDAYTEPDNQGAIPPRSSVKNAPYSERYEPGEDVAIKAMHREAPPFGPISGGTQHYPPCINPSCKSFGHSHPNCRCYGGGNAHDAGMFAEGGEVDSFCSDDRPHDEGCEYFKAGGLAEGEGPEDMAPAVEEKPMSVNLGPQDMPAPVEAPVQDTQNYERMPQAAPQQQPETQVQQFQNNKDRTLQGLGQEAQMFQSNLDAGHIRPETYKTLFAKKDTLGKVGTMFGLLLSGMGSGLTGQPNALLGMMNKEIENDLQAQQQSVGNEQNFLRINQQHVMNQAQAKYTQEQANTIGYALAKTKMNYATLHKLVEETQKLPPGPQKDQAMQTLAMMNQSVQNENFNVLDRAATGAAFYQTLFGNPSGEAAPSEQQFQKGIMGRKALGPQGETIAKDMEEKHIPGIPGQASAPLTSEDKHKINSGIEFDKRLDNFMKWTKEHSGSLNYKDMKYGQALAAQVQGAYREATNGGVYKEGEQNFISKIITENPTKFFNSIRVMPQLNAVKDDLHIRMDQTLKSKGFKGYKESKPSAKSSDNSEIKIVNGVKYKRGPDGKAVEVK